MAFLNDHVYDNGLSYLDTATLTLHVCSQEPTTYAQATSTYTLANSAISVGAPAAGSPNGRQVTVAAAWQWMHAPGWGLSRTRLVCSWSNSM